MRARRSGFLFVAVGLFLSSDRCVAVSEASEAVGSPAAVSARTAPLRVSYGRDAWQFAELWLPAGPGPHPVVLMVHGGCWQSAVANATIMHDAAAALQQRGIAVWNIDYRGVDEHGGGYPGTFQDVARAADKLALAPARYALDLTRIVAVGHSAGAHLAAWLAARPRLPSDSPLYTAKPLPIASVLLLGGLPDLRAARDEPEAACGTSPVDSLVGATRAGFADVYADTSPAALLPLGIPQLSINGARDRIAPPRLGRNYTELAQQAGDRAELHVVDDAGHFELITPGTMAFAEVLRLVAQELHVTP